VITVLRRERTHPVVASPVTVRKGTVEIARIAIR
jgi:hypothetical protein